MNPALLGFLRAIGLVVLVAILTYVSDTTHIAFIGNPVLEGLVAAIALAIEHYLEEKKGTALFGAVKTKK